MRSATAPGSTTAWACASTPAPGASPGASDASAEVVAYVRRVLDDYGVIWQMAELGKVDAGGGGTVACYMANRDIDTLDAGVPVLVHARPLRDGVQAGLLHDL